MFSLRDNVWLRRFGFTFLAVLTLVAWRRREQIKATLIPLFESIDSMGLWAPVILALLYIPACLLFIPNTFVSTGVGFLLGPIWGTLTAIIGLTLGNTCSFYMSRFLGRGWFRSFARMEPKFRAVEVACDREGFKVVMLTRLTPVFPSNLMSYLFGMTGVRWRDYAGATAVGMLPRTIVYTIMGAAAKSFADASSHTLRNSPWMHTALVVLGLVTGGVFFYITRIAQRSLDAALLAVETETGTVVELPEPSIKTAA